MHNYYMSEIENQFKNKKKRWFAEGKKTTYQGLQMCDGPG